MDEKWMSAVRLYKSLDLPLRDDMMNFAEFVVVNAISEVFGTLDGTVGSDLFDEEFVLSYGGDVLSGDLQDHFLERHED